MKSIINRMGKINGLNKFRKPLAYLPGLLVLSLGLYIVIDQPHIRFITNRIHEIVQLREENDNYRVFLKLTVFFRVWLFEVTNPEAVMAGDNPSLREIGPFVYDLHIEKHVIRVDEAADEINFTVTKTYFFNQKESGDLTEDTVVTVLNFAYLGTIQKIISLAATFLKKIGPIIHQIFPGVVSPFLTAKAGEIIFSGLPLDCTNVDKALNLICNVLKGNPPPLLKKTDTPGLFLYSLFYRVNGTVQGPFTVNRGIKNIYSLGNTTSFKNMRVTNYWANETCNVVRGTDAITWPPMPKKLSKIQGYEPQLCRSLNLSFMKEVMLNTLMGYQYKLTADVWNQKDMECYCPRNKKKVMECLPSGLMDIDKCQEVPVIFSEPHFLHASSELLDYAQGLHPSEEKHKTFIVLDPLTGAPISGSKKIQLNMKMSSIPTVPWFTNVSDGYFPLLWAEEVSPSTPSISTHTTPRLKSSISLVSLCTSSSSIAQSKIHE
ncbi:sensory neuron membrane protein 2-like [Diachasmimorpha longicaudata]|uniref:sensory neuron membrane protein 2-like n=1 Tax=Diachasmimorpha longicaudata TaxID=58733 RepID=UPI0030B8A131